jgi:hypothetical protein
MIFNNIESWSTTGSLGNTYYLIKTSTGITCDCLGFKNHKHCKHVDALLDFLKPSIPFMKQALIDYEVEWARDNMDKSEFLFLFKHGFKGFDNYTNKEIEQSYYEKFGRDYHASGYTTPKFEPAGEHYDAN